MTTYTFARESNNFDDILKDPNVKKYIDEVTTWEGHLMINMSDYTKDIDKVKMYVTLKYGDDLCRPLTKDYKPVMNVDYTPIRN
jgi:hypothetical protein